MEPKLSPLYVSRKEKAKAARAEERKEKASLQAREDEVKAKYKVDGIYCYGDYSRGPNSSRYVLAEKEIDIRFRPAKISVQVSVLGEGYMLYCFLVCPDLGDLRATRMELSSKKIYTLEHAEAMAKETVEW